MRKEVLWGSQLSAGGKLWDSRHLRSAYRWWITSGNRNSCGPCGSCYPLALVEAAGVWRQPQPGGASLLGSRSWGKNAMPPQVDLHKLVTESCAELRADKEGCLNAVWAPGSWFRTVLPLLIIGSLTWKKTLHVKVSLYRMQVSKSD